MCTEKNSTLYKGIYIIMYIVYEVHLLATTFKIDFR